MYSLVEVAGVMRLVIKVIDWGDAIELPPRQAAAGAQGQQPAAAAAAAPAPAVPAVLTSKNTCRHSENLTAPGSHLLVNGVVCASALRRARNGTFAVEAGQRAGGRVEPSSDSSGAAATADRTGPALPRVQVYAGRRNPGGGERGDRGGAPDGGWTRQLLPDLLQARASSVSRGLWNDEVHVSYHSPGIDDHTFGGWRGGST